MSTRYSEKRGVSVCTFAWRNNPQESASYLEVDAATRSASRADARVAERIDQALRGTGYLSLRNLEIIVTQGLVVLRGRLPSYYMKQVAQAAVRAVPGVGEVHDQLDVVSSRSAHH